MADTKDGCKGLPVMELAQRVAAMPTATVQDLLAALPLAARLAALGDMTPLKRLAPLCAAQQPALEPACAKLSQRGVMNLRAGRGEELVQALIAAQDIHCLLHFNAMLRLLPADACRSLQAWVEDAEHTPLEYSIIERLEGFLSRFPIPEERLLTVLAHPVSAFELGALSLRARSLPTIECELGPRVAAREYHTADAGAPSSKLKQAFERLDTPITVPRVGEMRLSRRLNDEWCVLLDIQREDGSPVRIERLRLGAFPGRKVGATQWKVELGPFGHSNCLGALDQALIVLFREGVRLKVL